MTTVMVTCSVQTFIQFDSEEEYEAERGVLIDNLEKLGTVDIDSEDEITDENDLD
jgi:hypothetical protein